MHKHFKKIVEKNLQTYEGRTLLMEIMMLASTFSHGFVPGDPSATAFHAGQRSIGLNVFEWILTCKPEILGPMQKEWAEMKRKEAEALAKQNKTFEEEINIEEGEEK